LLSLRLPTAILGAVALAAIARLAHAKQVVAPLADAPEKLDQIRITRHR
jgi:hypothetical protein